MTAHDLLYALSDAGMTVAAEGDQLVIRPGAKLTDELRAALREAKSELLALLRCTPDSRQPGPAATDRKVGDEALQRYLSRLLRLHWPMADTVAFAGRLVERDRSGDDRISCFECRHYRPGACRNYRRAELGGRDVGSDLAGLLQRCSGFALFQR